MSNQFTMQKEVELNSKSVPNYTINEEFNNIIEDAISLTITSPIFVSYLIAKKKFLNLVPIKQYYDVYAVKISFSAIYLEIINTKTEELAKYIANKEEVQTEVGEDTIKLTKACIENDKVLNHLFKMQLVRTIGDSLSLFELEKALDECYSPISVPSDYEPLVLVLANSTMFVLQEIERINWDLYNVIKSNEKSIGDKRIELIKQLTKNI